jgi:hypothetical protein
MTAEPRLGYKTPVLQGWAQRNLLRAILTTVRTEGDSFMGGAHGAAMQTPLGIALGRAVVNTGVGGSDMVGIRDRIDLPSNDSIRVFTTVLWDGSENGLTSVSQYMGLMADAVNAIGHNRYILIPTCHTYQQVSLVQDTAIRDAMQANWPGHVLDWRTVLPNTGGQLAEDMYALVATDQTHLSQAAHDLMAAAVAAFILASGW